MDYSDDSDDLEYFALILIIICGYIQIKNVRTMNRRWQERPHLGPENRRLFSQQSIMHQWRLMNDSEMFFKYLRFSPSEFDKLEQLLGSSLTHHSFSRECINPSTRLAITLRFLASGESQRSLALNYRIGDTTVHFILKEVLRVIPNIMKTIVMPVPDVHTFKKISEGFWSRWNFPHCCGCLDGKHVRIKKPYGAGSEYYNYMEYHSIVLLAICDHTYKFVLADVGAEGRQSDGGIFKNSKFGKKLRAKKMPLPPEDFVKNGPYLPYYFLADSAFALTEYMITPYARTKTPLPECKQIFNYRQSRARRVIENAFGILVSVFRIFKTEIDMDLETIDYLIMSTLCLHNFRLIENESVDDRIVDHEVNGKVVKGSWRENNLTLDQIGPQHGRHATILASNIRHDLTAFLVSKDGEVPWQYSIIDK